VPPADATALVAIGASAGGVEALRELVGKLPRDLRSAVLIVLHIPPSDTSVLADILTRAGPLPAQRAVDGMDIEPGRILVAPPDHHLLVDGVSVRLDRGPRINGHRPAIDPLFRSAATWYGPYAMGILLSGMLDDGVAGLAALLQSGAVTVAQSPDEAAYPDLPQNAIDRGAAAKVLTIQEIADLVVACSTDEPLTLEEVVAMQRQREEPTDANVSPFTCPHCHGSLWEIADPTGTRFQCRTGHSFTIESLVEVSTDALDDALWGAYRSLLEQADLCRRMARRMMDAGTMRQVDRYEQLARDAERRAWVLHDALVVKDESGEGQPQGGRRTG